MDPEGSVCFPLFQTPAAWLVQFLTGDHLNTQEQLAMFRACKRLHDMLLQHSACTHLTLPLLILGASTAVKTLQHASQHARNINLKLSAELSPQLAEIEIAWNVRRSSHISSFLKKASELGAMEAVTTLQLESANFDTILPAEVAPACVKLTKLVLDGCRITWDAASAADFTAQFASLQSLVLTHVYSSSSVKQHEAELREQLQGNKTLQSLTISRWGLRGWGDNEIAIVTAFASQLTCLCLDIRVSYNVVPSLRLDWAQLGVSLRHLQLPRGKVTDEGFRLLLAMPYLTQVEVDVDLTCSYVGWHCKWEELRCTSINVQTLAYLPLHSNMHLKVGLPEPEAGRAHLHLGASLDMVHEAIANVKKCKGISWGNQGVRVQSGDSLAEALQQQLVEKAQPLLGSCQVLWPE